MFKLLTHKIDLRGLRKLNYRINLNAVFTTGQLINLFFFFALMPYVSPIPLGSDVQIVTGAIAYLMIGILSLKDSFYFTPRELLIFLLGLFFIVYLNLDESSYQFKKAIGPIYAFGVYYIAKNYKEYFKLELLDIVLFIYLIGAFIQYLSPSLFNLTLEHFIRESKYSAAVSYRGLASLTTEASFLGIVCIYILIIQDWFYDKNKIKLDRKYYFRAAAAVFLVILTKSGAGYILLFLFFGSKSIGYLKKYWIPLSLVALIGIIVIANTDRVSNNKGLSDLVLILKSSSPKDLLRVSSLSNRVNPIIVGVTGALEEPLGRGSGSFTTQARDVYLNNNIEDIYPVNAYMRDKLLREISSDSVSTFGKYIFEYGIFFLLYLFLIFIGFNFKKAGVFILFVVTTGLLFALPIVYPPLWLIFGLYDRRVKLS